MNITVELNGMKKMNENAKVTLTLGQPHRGIYMKNINENT